jgi:predicted alpha/beta hydrolase
MPHDITIATSDGVALRATVHEPAGPSPGPACTVVLAHAMFARRTEFERPWGSGLAHTLARHGFRTIAFDFRGHGDSRPGRASEGATWTYDDLVSKDLPAVVAQARTDGATSVSVVGHSLGGHVAMAAQGTGAVLVDQLVAVAANVWLRHLEPSRLRWTIKLASLLAVTQVVRHRGFFPARALRMGSDDESAAYMAALARTARTGRWTSDDGVVDYAAALANIRVPVLAVASARDNLNCAPACAARMIEPLGGPKELRTITKDDDGGPAPDHMGMITSPRADHVRLGIATWLRLHSSDSAFTESSAWRP